MTQHQKPLRAPDIRQQNERLVLNFFYDYDKVSQSEIVSLTGLKPSTVLRIFFNLEQMGDIKISEDKSKKIDRKGRKPIYYTIEPTAHYVIGLNFGARSASLIIVDFGLTVIYENMLDLPLDSNAEQVLQNLADLIKASIRNAQIPMDKVLGIGIGAPGAVDMAQGRIINYPLIKGMADFNLQEQIESIFSIPVYIQNNCSLVARTEYRYGKGKEFGSLLLILIETSVDAAFVNTGNNMSNQGVTALNIGHMNMGTGEKHCICGQKGCLDTYLSEEAILSDIEEITGINSYHEIENALSYGNQKVIEALEAKGSILSRYIHNLYVLFRPQAFVIVSRLQSISEIFSNTVQAELEIDSSFYTLPAPAVISAPLDPVIAGRGAVDLVFDHFFNVGKQWHRPLRLS